MTLKFISTDQAVVNGIKVLVYSDAGIGKTVLCSTAPTPFILSAEAGLLSIRKMRIHGLQIGSIEDLEEAYKWLIGSKEAAWIQTICLDSVSEIAEQVLANAKLTVKDPRQAYGQLIDKMLYIVRCFRDIPGKNVYFSAKMEPFKDEMSGVVRYGPMMPGSKLGPQLPYFFDEVFKLIIVKHPQNGQLYRVLQTQPDLQNVAKDRSGALAPLEEANLTTIFKKIAEG